MSFATRRLRIIGIVGSALALLLLGTFAWFWRQLQQSLPPLDGARPLPGLAARATLTRDDLGAVTVRAATATDAARTLGFAHGQDRFFQMDLLRRRGAGELSALLGSAALDVDRSTRVHRFRDLAAVVLEREPAPRRALLEAYTEGVNAGLGSLAGRPWEYRLLRVAPEPWAAVDSILVLYAMAFDLQYATGEYDQTLAVLRNQLGSGAVDFFNPPIGPADGPLDGTAAPLPAPPGPGVIDLRRQPPEAAALRVEQPERAGHGSNAFALPGARTAHGGAIVAGDPHLDLRIPNTWYRARLEWTAADGSPVRVTGATLPGVPAVVIGSNGRLAWSLTNSCADTGDLVALDLNQTAPEIFYHRGREMLEFERRTDVIAVKGGDPVTVESTWTIWGPVVGRDERGKQLVYKWTLHDPAAANFALFDLATAGSVDEGIAVAHRCGIPPQNIVLADAAGAVAWTIAGQLPNRFGFDGRFPVAWTYGDRGWDGFLDPAQIPVWRPEPDTALWSANQRHLGGEAFARLGDGGYFEGDRALHLRDDLAALGKRADQRAEPADLLAVQLDARGKWLERWRTLLLATLDADGADGAEERAEFRRLVAGGELTAAPDSVAYRLVREWHDRLRVMTLAPIFAECLRQYPDFNYGLLRAEEALWALHAQEPPHLLAPAHASWAALRNAAVDAVRARLEESGTPLAEASWGRRNQAAIRHPFSRILPLGLGSWLDLPPDELAGDYHLPRVQRPSFGASLRLAVAPGREEEGLLHLPAGQSGHPLSPYYRAGHAAWARGEPLPLLPGEAVHTLTFEPAP